VTEQGLNLLLEFMGTVN